MPVAHPVPAMAGRAIRAQYRQHLTHSVCVLATLSPSLERRGQGWLISHPTIPHSETYTFLSYKCKRKIHFLLSLCKYFVSLHPTRSSPPLSSQRRLPEQKGREGQILLEKDVYETLSSTSESRKFKTRRERNWNVHIGCIVPCPLAMVGGLYNISRRGLSRVAYPGQGNARARMWDKRV